MTTLAWALFGVAFAFAIVDWYAVATSREPVEYVCKPAAALVFLACVLALDPTFTDVRAWFAVALVCCAMGDTFLMLPRNAFVPGLAAFLVAQVCFTVGFALTHPDLTDLAIGIVVMLAVAVPLAVRTARALQRAGRDGLVAPVLAYVGAISAMVATAIGSGIAAGIVGAALFFASDALIAEQRFVRPRAWGPVAIIVTYHLALGGLVLSLAA
jgi:uncharacterized membrane protein YhhN